MTAGITNSTGNEGKIIPSNIHLVNTDQTYPNIVQTVNLNTVLPNDGCKYLMHITATISTSGQNYAELRATSNIMANDCIVCGTNNSFKTGGCGTLLIGEDHLFKWYHTRGTGNNVDVRSTQIYVVWYQRL